IASARGADAAGVPLIVSCFTTTPICDIVCNTTQPVWFQLYVQRDRALTRDMVELALEEGCTAVCVTVDCPVFGPRYSQRNFSLPNGIECAHLSRSYRKQLRSSEYHGAASLTNQSFDPSFCWRDLAELRHRIRCPLLLKGLLHPADCGRAVDEGVDGIIVSNHGGRNLDTTPASIDALPQIVNVVAGRVPILLDSGIRRGTDVIKALALGGTGRAGREAVYLWTHGFRCSRRRARTGEYAYRAGDGNGPGRQGFNKGNRFIYSLEYLRTPDR